MAYHKRKYWIPEIPHDYTLNGARAKAYQIIMAHFSMNVMKENYTYCNINDSVDEVGQVRKMGNIIVWIKAGSKTPQRITKKGTIWKRK